MTAPKRVCFVFAVAPEDVSEYVRRHSPVRAELLRELHAAGIRDYSIFLGPDGRLVGTYVTTDPARTDAYLSGSAVAAEWDQFMTPLFRRDADGTVAVHYEEVFNLDEQLAAL